MAQSEQQAGVNQRIVGGKPLGVKPIRLSGSEIAGVILNTAPQSPIESVADPGRAVVTVVVVVVEAVLRQFVPFEEVLQLLLRLQRHLQLLDPHGAIRTAVELHV
jgi:hypothetical protein